MRLRTGSDTCNKVVKDELLVWLSGHEPDSDP